ncbi:MAG: hypothetical protein R6U63_11830 [Longimicrobiales bacterium]
MLSRCIFCGHEFPANATLEHFPVGGRVGFDPHRGRLWAICALCRRWTLAPFEERWEALEELKRFATDRARLLGQTDTIALLRTGDVEIVQIGRCSRREEAWWRYGRALSRQRSRIARLSGLNNVVFGAVVVAAALTGEAALLGGLGAWVAPGFFRHVLRERRFGMTAWRGEAPCRQCGRTRSRLHFTERRRLIIGPSEERGLSLRLPCEGCGAESRNAGYRLPDRGAEHLLRRVLAYHNHAGASESRVGAAVEVIEAVGSAPAWVDRVASRQTTLRALDRTSVLALEIALSEEAERVALRVALSELEAEWEEAERIAAIADGELTQVSAVDTLRDAPASQVDGDASTSRQGGRVN